MTNFALMGTESRVCLLGRVIFLEYHDMGLDTLNIKLRLIVWSILLFKKLQSPFCSSCHVLFLGRTPALARRRRCPPPATPSLVHPTKNRKYLNSSAIFPVYFGALVVQYRRHKDQGVRGRTIINHYTALCVCQLMKARGGSIWGGSIALNAVLLIRDGYPESRFFSIPDPRSNNNKN